MNLRISINFIVLNSNFNKIIWISVVDNDNKVSGADHLTFYQLCRTFKSYKTAG